jgi:hypothetical protein
MIDHEKEVWHQLESRSTTSNAVGLLQTTGPYQPLRE